MVVRISTDHEANERRYVAWFHDLDAWTEYWDVYHPESRGHFYFGDGEKERGLLTRFLPREQRPPAFVAWTHMALALDSGASFQTEVRRPDVASAIIEIDALVERLFAQHFGEASDQRVQVDYLDAIFRFATDSLPPAADRDRLIAEDDPRKRTAGRHTLDGDLSWFAWALELEGANAVVGADHGHARRSLLLGGVASGCAANFAWRGHRRTRDEYQRNDVTKRLLLERGLRWATDFAAAAEEVHALYRIREWGSEA